MTFGERLDRASNHFLTEVRPGSQVLILGGGTGECLCHLPACSVHYVEKSCRMATLAGKRTTKASVCFQVDDFLTWESDINFDVVLCPFFLDVFDRSDLLEVLYKIKRKMTRESELIVTDFHPTQRFSHLLLLQLMHWFFNATADLQSKKLQPLAGIIENQGFDTIARKEFLSGLVFSQRFKMKD